MLGHYDAMCIDQDSRRVKELTRRCECVLVDILIEVVGK